MKKYILITLLFLIIYASFQINPLRKDNKTIENMMLERIPYGTDFTAAQKIIEDSRWSIEYIELENGYDIYDEQKTTMVGKKYMCVYLGEYRNLFVTDVSAFLIFDDNSKLIRIVIQKDTDGL